MHNPLEKFQYWWQAVLLDSPLQQKSAVCVSTIDADGFPSARFVDLKAVNENGFIFCTSLSSEKSRHIRLNHKIALTAWWDHMGYQVRVTGIAKPLAESDAIVFWQSRDREAQLTTLALEQSKLLTSETAMMLKVKAVGMAYTSDSIPKPANWGGYCVDPISIEFLTFKESRLHLRELYVKTGSEWRKSLLQP